MFSGDGDGVGLVVIGCGWNGSGLVGRDRVECSGDGGGSGEVGGSYCMGFDVTGSH